MAQAQGSRAPGHLPGPRVFAYGGSARHPGHFDQASGLVRVVGNEARHRGLGAEHVNEVTSDAAMQCADGLLVLPDCLPVRAHLSVAPFVLVSDRKPRADSVLCIATSTDVPVGHVPPDPATRRLDVSESAGSGRNGSCQPSDEIGMVWWCPRVGGYIR